MSHPVSYWLSLMLIGGIAGALGQVIRMMVGLKKVREEALAKNLPANALIQTSQIFFSLAVGFTAGALAAITVTESAEAVTIQELFGFAGAGYAGADFIEGLMHRVVPQAAADVNGSAAGAVTDAAAASAANAAAANAAAAVAAAGAVNAATAATANAANSAGNQPAQAALPVDDHVG